MTWQTLALVIFLLTWPKKPLAYRSWTEDWSPYFPGLALTFLGKTLPSWALERFQDWKVKKASHLRNGKAGPESDVRLAEGGDSFVELNPVKGP